MSAESPRPLSKSGEPQPRKETQAKRKDGRVQSVSTCLAQQHFWVSEFERSLASRSNVSAFQPTDQKSAVCAHAGVNARKHQD